MLNKKQNMSQGAAVTPSGVIMYCYNAKTTSLLDLVNIENMAFEKAMQRQWQVFKLYTPVISDVELIISLN